MAELNFKQIADKLNEEFKEDRRKLIFWYDANAEFIDDVDNLEIQNAKILHLEKDNQVYTKYYLECEDVETSYLVYAPFKKPDIRENHLADTIRYSKEFFADRTSLLCVDLGINEKYKEVIQKHIKFFNNKDRVQAFYSLGISDYNNKVIEVALMSILCKSKIASFDDVARTVIIDGEFENNKYLDEFSKYDLVDCFWAHVEEAFGYADTEPTLEKFAMSAFATYAARTIHAETPSSWSAFMAYKPGSIMTFIDNMMNNVLYADRFDSLSMMMYKALNAEAILSDISPEALVDCALFAGIDDIIIKWMIGRLEAEDVSARLEGRTIPEVCAIRRKMHFGTAYRNEYFVIQNAYQLINPGMYTQISGTSTIAKKYIESDYAIDRTYRYFYYYYDKLTDSSAFETIRETVENIYTNDYLNNITANWSLGYVADDGSTGLENQRNFFNKYVRYKKEKVVVIISDALRYEVGMSLYDKLHLDEKCDVKISAMQSVLPSITSFGMAALLPHKNVTIDSSYKVLCDDNPCADISQREKILQVAKPNSKCAQFDLIKNMKQADLRSIFTGMDVVYVYHNQIDARGDKAASENEVFSACEEAISEIYNLIKKISTQANTYHFIITADHGFLYKRDCITESDKIAGIANAARRYAISDSGIDKTGVASIPMNTYLPEDNRYLISPVGSEVFKAPGAGLNYVHGGCSPQEMIIPVIEVRAEKNKVETSGVTLDLISNLTKVTGLAINLEFLQSEPVSDTSKEASYRIMFVDEDGSRISNEVICHADRKETDSTKRIFKMKFSLKNQSYDKKRKYYLICQNEKNGLEIIRREVIMDIAFAGDFGFGF